MIKTAIIAATFSQLAFGAYIDCEHYSTDAECTADTACYKDPNIGICRADCSKITFFIYNVGVPSTCAAVGCLVPDTSGYDSGFEGDIPCSSVTYTAEPSATPAPSAQTLAPTASPTKSPTEPDATQAPSAQTPAPSDQTPAPSDVTPAPTDTTPSPTTTTTASTSSTQNSGDGRCSADGTVQEQVFGPGEYKCGDYGLGQPEERCIYIDASSTCTGTDFNDCGTEAAAWPTFQSALNSLKGETVVLIVKAGVYSGEGNVNIISPNLGNLNEYVYLNIFSESGSDDTIIDCKGEGFGFHLYQTTIRLDGFTIINCVAEERDTFSLPSYATNDYIQSFPNSGRLGGALFLDRTFITMNDMIIVNNGGEYGGAIFQYQNSIRMNNSIVEYNCATNSGGGIFLLFANLYMWNSYVLCNEADVFGGGIFGHQQRTDIREKTLVDENSAAYGDELFVDRTTVNVVVEEMGMVSDNDVDSWAINDVVYCPLDNNAAYEVDANMQRGSINFCSRSDSDLVDDSNLLSLANDEGSCKVEIVSPAPTVTGATTRPTTDSEIVPAGSSDANGYKLFAVTLVTMVVSFL